MVNKGSLLNPVPSFQLIHYKSGLNLNKSGLKFKYSAQTGV